MNEKNLKTTDRINRSTYLISYVVSMVIFFIIYLIVGLMFTGSLGLSSIDDTNVYNALLILSIPYTLYHLVLASKRFHDLNKETLYILFLFLPIINIYYSLVLLFKSGDNKKNLYGYKPNGTYIYKGTVEQEVKKLSTIRIITISFIVIGAFIALITSIFWYDRLYMTPEKRFWIAINNSMATPSVVRTLTQGGSGNQVEQDYRFNFAPQRVVQNKVVYTERSATTDTSVTTEGIIYPTVQYLRYTEFTNSRSDNVNAANIDEVLGAWAVQESEDEEQARLNYLSEQVSLVIFGNYGAQFRNDVLKEMQDSNIYGNNLSNAIENIIDDEEVYEYQIEVKLRKYAELLNRAFVRAGYGEFPPLNPDNYAEDSTVNGSIRISKKNNTIVEVGFGGREESYGNYGVIIDVERPEASLTVEELQQKVQELLQASDI